MKKPKQQCPRCHALLAENEEGPYCMICELILLTFPKFQSNDEIVNSEAYHSRKCHDAFLQKQVQKQADIKELQTRVLTRLITPLTEHVKPIEGNVSNISDIEYHELDFKEKDSRCYSKKEWKQRKKAVLRQKLP